MPKKQAGRFSANVIRRAVKPELYFGLTRAIGTDLTEVISELASALQDSLFDANGERGRKEIRLSHLLDGVPPINEALKRRPELERYRSYMNAGDILRGLADRPDAMALLGVRHVRSLRSQPLDPKWNGRAFILRSLMHPAEITTLRRIYGKQFFAISVFSPEDQREKALARKLAESNIEAEELQRPRALSLMNRDVGIVSRDDDAGLPVAPRYRLDVRRTFERADLFVSAADLDESRKAIRRFISLIFGHPFETPTRDEYGMAMAYATSSRSASLSRRVGACLTDEYGEVIATGTNEVPKFGGSTYWPGDEPDCRDFQLGQDSSDRIRREMLVDVVRRLAQDTSWLSALLSCPPNEVPSGDSTLEEAVQAAISSRMLEGSRMLDVVEYSRAVHAEMAAITDAARRGVQLRDATLYCTTFPCHECARHIVGAGINRVVYIEPYPKSRVAELYADSIGLADRGTNLTNLVRFEPFIGVAPRCFSDLFSSVPRKQADADPQEAWLSGRPVVWSPATATLRPSILDREVYASGASRKAMELTEKHFVDAFEERLGQLSANTVANDRRRTPQGKGRR